MDRLETNQLFHNNRRRLETRGNLGNWTLFGQTLQQINRKADFFVVPVQTALLAVVFCASYALNVKCQS